MKDLQDLRLILDTRVPIVAVETFEEKRAIDLLLRVATEQDRVLFRWSVTEGLVRASFGAELNLDDALSEPEAVLKHIRSSSQPGIYALCDFHPFLSDEPKITRWLKDIAIQHHTVPHTVVLLSHELAIPPEISRYCARFSLSLPDDEEIMAMVRDEARLWINDNGGRVKTEEEVLHRLVSNLRGLTHADVRRLARGAIVDDGAITESDVPEVNRAKFQLMDMEGVLSFEYNTEQFSNVGGLSKLKIWLEERASSFREATTTVDRPRGLMLLGVQGSGKSLAAKAVAGLWGLPLLRLDFGALYNKFFGETEKNLREALELADLMAPCVLWMDELEKGIATDGNDSGTSQRVLGTLLTWLSERQSAVFVVATSNDISGLPPELVRKGRLDEIFFVDLPSPTVRQDIFAIHLRKRELEPSGFDLPGLADATEGFSGAEIEQAIVASVYIAAARQKPVDTDIVLEEIRRTSPLSVVMKEKLDELRRWSQNRTVMTD